MYLLSVFLIPLFTYFAASFLPQAFMDEDHMLNWINRCFAPRLPSKSSGKRTLIILDSFQAHITHAVRDSFDELNVDIAVIPGDMAILLDDVLQQLSWHATFYAEASLSVLLGQNDPLCIAMRKAVELIDDKKEN